MVTHKFQLCKFGGLRWKMRWWSFVYMLVLAWSDFQVQNQSKTKEDPKLHHLIFHLGPPKLASLSLSSSGVWPERVMAIKIWKLQHTKLLEQRIKISPKHILQIYLEGIFIPPQNPRACNVVWISSALRWRSPRTPRDRASMEWAKIHSSGYQTMTSKEHRQWAPYGGQKIQQCPQTNLLNLQMFHLRCHVLRSPFCWKTAFYHKFSDMMNRLLRRKGPGRSKGS